MPKRMQKKVLIVILFLFLSVKAQNKNEGNERDEGDKGDEAENVGQGETAEVKEEKNEPEKEEEYAEEEKKKKEKGEEDEEEEENSISISFSIFLCIYVCLTLRHWFTNCNLPIPYGAFTIVLGLVLGWFAKNTVLLGTLSNFYTNVVTFLYFYVPALLFKVAFCIDINVFKKAAVQIIIISFPIYIVQSLIMGYIMKAVLNQSWPDAVTVLFGVLCTAVYPMDVVKHLNNMGTYTKSITLLLEGEAMCGLATGIISSVVIEASVTNVAVYWYHYFFLTCRFVLLGALVGYIIGYIFCYIMRSICLDIQTLLVFTLLAPFFSFNIVSGFCGLTGCMTVIVIGLMMGNERANLTPETNRVLTNVWDMVVLINTTVMSLSAGVTTAYHTIPEVTWEKLLLVLITYVLTNLTRLVSWALFLPILRHIGLGLSVRSMAVCVWGGIKSRVSLGVVLLVYENYDWDLPFRGIFLMHTVIIYWLSLFINGTTLPWVCELLNISEATLARHVNMNNCLMYIYARKHQAIHVIKMERFMADVNWPYVKELTVLKPPYDQPFSYKRDHGHYFLDYSIVDYPGVNKNLPISVQKVEQVRAENIKVSNAKKVFYSRMFERGIISSDVYKVIIGFDNAAMDTKETLFQLDKLYDTYQSENWVKQSFRKLLLKFNADFSFRPPRNYWRRKCYHIIRSKLFKVWKYLLLFINCSILVLELYLREDFEYVAKLLKSNRNRQMYYSKNLFILGHILFFIFLDTSEIVLKIMAYSLRYIKSGIGIFFKSFWNWLLFISYLLYALYIAIFFINFFDNIATIGIIIALLPVKVIRLIELFSLFDFYNAKILINSLNAKINTNRMFAYELATIFMKGEIEIKNVLPHLVGENDILLGLKYKMENNITIAKKHMAFVQRERPWIAATIKTKQAIRFILNGMNEAIDDLKFAGWLDDVEYLNLTSSLNDKFKRLSVMRTVQPSPGRVILREVSWMNNTIADYLQERATLKTYKDGDVICRPGRAASGIFVVISGMFILEYTPTDEVVQKYNELGCLPIVDFGFALDVTQPICEYILPGHCIGELSHITERYYDCTITSMAAQSQVYYLSNTAMRRARLKDNDNIHGLKSRIWKSISARIVLHILVNVPAYRSKTTEEIRYIIERAFLPDLYNFSSFIVNELMEDVILIEGKAVDVFTSKIYTGPCYIPRFVKKLTLISSRKVSGAKKFLPQLWVLPVEGVNEYAAMANNTEFEMMTTYSSTCLQHLARARAKKWRQERKRKEEKKAESRPVVLEEIISLEPR